MGDRHITVQAKKIPNEPYNLASEEMQVVHVDLILEVHKGVALAALQLKGIIWLRSTKLLLFGNLVPPVKYCLGNLGRL